MKLEARQNEAELSQKSPRQFYVQAVLVNSTWVNISLPDT